MKKVAVFQHTVREHPSRIDIYAHTRGITLDTVRLWEPYTMPDLANYDALIVLGGPMGVYENFPSKQDELTAITRHHGSLPILGICLGGQLLAHALGATVQPHREGDVWKKEVGHYIIELTEEGEESALFQGFPKTFPVFQWHGDTFGLPRVASHLARGGICENQAFQVGSSFGVQFHLEHTPYALAHLLDTYREWVQDGCDINEDALLEEAHRLAPTLTEQCFRMLDNFLAL